MPRYPRKSFAVILTLCMTLSAQADLFAQDPSDYAIQANIIYRFTKYVDWPDAMKTGDFVIGVVGDCPIYDQLKDFVVNKYAGTQKIVVKKFANGTHTYNCHIIFVSDDERSALKKIVSGTTNSSTLIVTESDGVAKKGSCINFINIQDRLKIEINKNNIEQRRLGIATELLSLGKLVK